MKDFQGISMVWLHRAHAEIAHLACVISPHPLSG
jgi:hypothetical protein